MKDHRNILDGEEYYKACCNDIDLSLNTMDIVGFSLISVIYLATAITTFMRGEFYCIGFGIAWLIMTWFLGIALKERKKYLK